jgi:hypothetical protein
VPARASCGRNVNEGREIYLPAFGHIAHGGDELGVVGWISDRDSARITPSRREFMTLDWDCRLQLNRRPKTGLPS